MWQVKKKNKVDENEDGNIVLMAEGVEEEDLYKQQNIRNGWKLGSRVEIYSESQEKWIKGVIIKIFNDDQGEWLVIKYTKPTKQIQRFNQFVRPISNGKSSKQQKSWSDLKKIYTSSPSETTSSKDSHPWLYPCPHGNNLSIDELGKIKIRNRRVCAVRGIPSIVTEKILHTKQWYGNFKGIKRIQIHDQIDDESDSVLIFITFDNEESVVDAIDFSNNATFNNGRKLKAAFAIQYYCRQFLAKKQCKLSYCRYQHEWVKDLKDVITLAEQEQFKGM